MKKIIIKGISVALICFNISCKDSTPEPVKPVTSSTTSVDDLDMSGARVGTDLGSLPKDTGGLHTPKVLGSDASPFGYYLYTPSGYTPTGPKFPLLIFLHGAGEVGNSQVNPSVLDKVLANGPPKLINNKTWAPKYPMVVASMQSEGWWDPAKVKKFTEFMMKTYQIDTTRIYMTGLSMGGYGTWDQVTFYGKGSHITAAVPICGSGLLPIPAARVLRASAIPTWGFHGADDKTVLPDFSKKIRNEINKLLPAITARVTIYPNTGHDAWTKTYTRTGTAIVDPLYNPFQLDIYSWMFLYSK